MAKSKAKSKTNKNDSLIKGITANKNIIKESFSIYDRIDYP